MSQFTTQIQQYIDAAYPLLYVQSHEEGRVLEDLKALDVEGPIYHWAGTVGFRLLKGDASAPQADKETAPQKVLEKIIAFPAGTVTVLKDFHGTLGNSIVTRLFRDMLPLLESTHKAVIFLSPVVTIPVELEKDVTVLPYALPSAEDLGVIFDRLVAEQEVGGARVDVSARQAVVAAASATTANEARNAFALAYGKHGRFDAAAARTVLHEKAGILRKAGLLEWVEPDLGIEKLGGMGNVKAYLDLIAPIFWNPEEAVAYGFRPQDFPRMFLLIGPPGTGKTLAAQVVANVLRIGCVRTDIGKVFSQGGGRSGAAEGNIELRNQQVEAMAPTVDIWDEADKMLQMASGKSEANPWEARVAASILTWAESHRSRALVAATANRQALIAVEMLSRFQKVFFVDLPVRSERAEIIKIHADERPVIKLTARDVDQLAARTEDYSGRELRNVIQRAMAIGFTKKMKAITGEVVADAVDAIRPAAKMRPEEIAAMRQWAKDNDVEWASAAADNVHVAAPRRVRTGRA